LATSAGGRFIEPNAHSIADALLAFERDSGLARRTGAAARELVERRHSVQSALAAHEALFRRLLRGEAAAG
jgi:glycosyltransferase involved in cell wall biosynthesis